MCPSFKSLPCDSLSPPRPIEIESSNGLLMAYLSTNEVRVFIIQSSSKALPLDALSLRLEPSTHEHLAGTSDPEHSKGIYSWSWVQDIRQTQCRLMP